MTRTGERGVALVFTLFLMAALSAMAVSMMFLAQTETSASRNYKTMSQARYAGEAGVQRVIHYLSSTTYTNAVTSTTGFNTGVSPVTLTDTGETVTLTPYVDTCPTSFPSCPLSKHPDTAVKNAFAALFSSASLPIGSNNATVTYTATATLLSMRQMAIYGGGTGVIQTWRINATGTVPGTLPATVEVAAILERDATQADTYAIFATGGGCAAINLGGGAETNSYDSGDSTSMATTPPTTTNSGGSVGTNGNLRLVGGQTRVRGNLDTPRTGVGNCNSGNITALDGNPPQVTGDTIQLPQAKTYPDPAAPTPPPPTTSLSISSADCTGLGIVGPLDTCFASGSTITITKGNPMTAISWGNVAVSGTTNIVIQKGALFGNGAIKLNVNSFSLAGNSTLSLGANTSVTMNVAGVGVSGAVVDFEGGSFSNPSYDPSRFQILYAGTQPVKLTGGSAAAATVYAPNADITMSGGADFYGSVLGKTVTASGQLNVHYDRALAAKFFTLGNHVMSSFSWQKY